MTGISFHQSHSVGWRDPAVQEASIPEPAEATLRDLCYWPRTTHSAPQPAENIAPQKGPKGCVKPNGSRIFGIVQGGLSPKKVTKGPQDRLRKGEENHLQATCQMYVESRMKLEGSNQRILTAY
jgi:hypothetical protein